MVIGIDMARRTRSRDVRMRKFHSVFLYRIVSSSLSHPLLFAYVGDCGPCSITKAVAIFYWPRSVDSQAGMLAGRCLDLLELQPRFLPGAISDAAFWLYFRGSGDPKSLSTRGGCASFPKGGGCCSQSATSWSKDKALAILTTLYSSFFWSGDKSQDRAHIRGKDKETWIVTWYGWNRNEESPMKGIVR